MKTTLLFLCIGLSLFSAYSQSAIPEDKPVIVKSENSGAASISSFYGLRIGMGIDQAKEVLKENSSLFDYRGDPDVYFLPAKEQTLIECASKGYVKRIFLQFKDKVLFSIIVDLNTDKIDYFTLFTALNEKYGAFDKFTPDYVYWEKSDIRLSLEKPLTVKYLDLSTFRKIVDDSKAGIVLEEESLKDFLKEF